MYNDKEYNYDLIKGMNAIIISMNDERAYEEWIWTVPDQPTESDFQYIADEPILFEETINEFIRIFNKYIKYGLFIQTTVADTEISKLFTGKRG